MAHIITPTFICTLAGKYGDRRDTCPLDGKCIQHGKVCEYLEMRAGNPPRWRPPKVFVPPTPAHQDINNTSTDGVMFIGRAEG